MTGWGKELMGVRSDALLAGAYTSGEAERESGPEAAAEMYLRRLANRHGHERLVITGSDGEQVTVEHCPSRHAHERDLETLRLLLEAAGLPGSIR